MKKRDWKVDERGLLIPKSIKLKCTRRIIDESIPGNQRHCMEAKALMKAEPLAWSIRVDSSLFRFNIGGRDGDTHRIGTRFFYQNPARSGKEAERLDRHGKAAVEPFEFTLDRRQCSTSKVILRGERGEYAKRRKPAKRTKGPRRCAVRRFGGSPAWSE